MKNVILKLVAVLTIILSLSACSDLKKEVTIRTNGGEKITIKIKVPKQFKDSKDAYFAIYPLAYMYAWNEGVNESDNPKSEYKFNADRYAKASAGSVQANVYMAEEMEEYFKSKKEEERIKAEGRAFANKHKE